MPNTQNKPIVRSLLENDLYKFTMWQALLHSHPGAQAEYAFVCRNTPAYPLATLKNGVEKELDRLCSMKFSEDELEYLLNLRFIKSDFVDFLSIFHFQRRFVKVSTEGDKLIIVASGPIVHVMAFEIFVLYIVNELYFQRLSTNTNDLDIARARLHDKIGLIKNTPDVKGESPFTFADFGLSRRFSGGWHEEVVRTLNASLPEHFIGTSNVYLAKKLGLTPIGTMAHEYLQAYQAFGFRLRDFQKAAFEGWVQEYRGDLGIVLTDVIGMDAFLKDFDLYFAKLFDGLRQDSGDPVAWGEKAIAHYKSLRIDPMTKRLVFSDALNVSRAIELHQHFKGRIKTVECIGTNLTNDTPYNTLNIVMKMVSCNGQPVAKLSDAPGKTICDNQPFLSYLRDVFKHPEVE
jgi:nicotinate phosphoribosyltransferase